MNIAVRCVCTYEANAGELATDSRKQQNVSLTFFVTPTYVRWRWQRQRVTRVSNWDVNNTVNAQYLNTTHNHTIAPLDCWISYTRDYSFLYLVYFVHSCSQFGLWTFHICFIESVFSSSSSDPRHKYLYTKYTNRQLLDELSMYASGVDVNEYECVCLRLFDDDTRVSIPLKHYYDC